MWALVNGSVNMCQSDKTDLQPFNNKLLCHEPTYLHPLRDLKDAWKRFPWLGVEIEIASLIPLHFWSLFEGMKIFLSHPIIVKSVDKLGPPNLPPLAYQLDGYLSPISLSQGQAWTFLPTVLIQTFFSSALAVGLVWNQLHIHNLTSCEYTLRNWRV